MGNTNLTTIVRKCERAATIQAEAKDAAVTAAGPVLESAYSEFKAANTVVNLLTTQARKERTHTEEVIQSFAQEYDKTRSSIQVRMPFAELPDRASAMGTGDDIVNAGESAKELLFKVGGVDESHPLDGEGEAAPTGEAWAVSLAKQFVPHLEAAKAEYRKSFITAEQQKKAIEVRAEKREVLDSKLLAFRRVVRDVYGSKSREYHSLRDRTEPDAASAAPSPPAPAPVPTAVAA